MSIGDLTRWQSRNEQRFELTLTINENIYHYTLVIEHDRDRRRMRIIKELLSHNDQPIFDFRDGNAQSFTMIIIPEDLNISSTGLIQVLAL